MSSEMTMLSDPYISADPAAGYPLSICEYGAAYTKPLSTYDDYYDKVDWQCSLEPYVDKLYWRIDGLSPYKFPNNVIWERGHLNKKDT